MVVLAPIGVAFRMQGVVATTLFREKWGNLDPVKFLSPFLLDQKDAGSTSLQEARNPCCKLSALLTLQLPYWFWRHMNRGGGTDCSGGAEGPKWT